jgi:hypothetical protein
LWKRQLECSKRFLKPKKPETWNSYRTSPFRRTESDGRGLRIRCNEDRVCFSRAVYRFFGAPSSNWKSRNLLSPAYPGNPYTLTRLAPTPRCTPPSGCGPGLFCHIGRKKGRSKNKLAAEGRRRRVSGATKPSTPRLATVEAAKQALKLSVGVLDLRRGTEGWPRRQFIGGRGG